MSKIRRFMMPKAVLLLISAFWALSLNAAQLTIPDVFEFLALDGKEIGSSFLSHRERLELTEGKHKIALRYKDVVIDPDLGYESVINSKPFIVTLQVKQGVSYRLEPEKSAFRDRHAFAKNPVVTLSSEAGKQPVAVKTGKPESRQEKWVRDTALKNNKPDQPPVLPETIASRQPEQPKVGKEDVGERLRYWWSQADKETRQEFMGWVVGQ